MIVFSIFTEKNLNLIPQIKEYDVKNSGVFMPMYLCCKQRALFTRG